MKITATESDRLFTALYAALAVVGAGTACFLQGREASVARDGVLLSAEVERERSQALSRLEADRDAQRSKKEGVQSDVYSKQAAITLAKEAVQRDSTEPLTTPGTTDSPAPPPEAPSEPMGKAKFISGLRDLLRDLRVLALRQMEGDAYDSQAAKLLAAIQATDMTSGEAVRVVAEQAGTNAAA